MAEQASTPERQTKSKTSIFPKRSVKPEVQEKPVKPEVPEKPVKPNVPVKPELPSRSEKSVKPELPVTSEKSEPQISESELQLSDIKLQCSLCQETLQEPKLLPCLHTFCRIPCLERIVVNDNGRQSLACPTCQYIVPLTDNGIAGLQTDLHAENMLKGYQTLRKHKKTEHNCQNCEKSPAVTHCQECKIIMCEECKEMHQMFSCHKLLSLNEVKSSDPITTILSAAKCEKHEKREAIIFCETCSELICEDCTVNQHRGHLCSLIDDVFPRHKEELIASVKSVQEMMDKIETGIDLFNSRAKKISDQRATLEADIRRDIDQLHKILDQRKEELLAILDQNTQQKLSDLETQRVEIEKRQEKVNRCLDYATGCLQAGQRDEVLRMKAPILERIEELKALYDQSTLHPMIEFDTKYLTGDTASRACKEFGKVVCKKTLKVNCYDDIDDHGANIELIDNQSYLPVSYDNKQALQQAEQKWSPVASPNLPKPWVPRKPISRKSLVKPVRVVEGLHGPFGVTLNSQQQVIIVENSKHKVLVMSSTGKKIMSFGKQGISKGQFKRPSGVTVDNYDFIYITDSSNHRVQKFNSDGRFTAAVGSRGKGAHQFVNPTGICFNKTNHLLYVCDQGNHRIQVLTTDLTTVRSIGSPAGRNGALSYPKSCAFDSSNNLYVADSGNNCVPAFTSEGEFLSAFTNNYSLEKPFAIAIDGNDNIYVSESDQNHVNVFNVRGDHLSSFGVKGSKEGQFQDIRDICFNGSTNTLIVSDFSNNRIQMFVV